MAYDDGSLPASNPAEMCVCCSITSLTRIAYGSVVWRQGRSLPFRLNQARSSSSTGTSLDERPATGNSEYGREQSYEQVKTPDSQP